MDITYRLQEITEVARQFLDVLGSAKVFAIKGEMGAGKTTFIHAVCDVLHVSSVVGSPTYAIINEYAYPAGKVFHIDLYRLKDEQEALQAGVEDCLYSGNLCFVEWPERAAGLFPEHTRQVEIQLVNEQTRHLRILDN
jgi:tRNA threonylcarbamoyladenosine biosynthesis protein TsaE